ncbi:HbrB-domain-containing protein [Dacryopinax primogenitus]|uniref:HbrB-domain-containing protein n=1 Tax=Dacryopinax primogenitus (strain DJM 731) TaxID=1858805 RepID=M5FX32_DACPD|nr:HbrB-domain-containing protein [Dacryopinax primogenitus]EJU00984.1 HbrB-domain-containing protein [Dacryopinax primogenitus]
MKSRTPTNRAASPLPPPPPPPPPRASSPTGPDTRSRASSDTPRPIMRQPPQGPSHSRSNSPIPDHRILTKARRTPIPTARGQTVDIPTSLPTAPPSSSSFHHFQPTRSQSSRPDGSYPSSLLREAASSPIPQKSPQKSLRNYDTKHIRSELDRLGFLPHLPSSPQLGLPHSHSHHITIPHLGAPLASSTSLSLSPQPPSQLPILSASQAQLAAQGEPWPLLHVHVLPLFNGEPLRVPIEDLNILVRAHLHAAISRSPSKVMQMMEADLNELVSTGMVTLNAGLHALEGDKLLARLVDKWGFFYGQVLPYVEGVFLPFQTDPLLNGLRSSTKRVKDQTDEEAPILVPANRVDVRMLVLHAFRDRVLDGLYPKLLTYLKSRDFEKNAQWGPKFQQMLLVLISSSSSQPNAAPTAAHLLLRAFSPTIRPLHGQYAYQSPVSLPSFSSASLSRPRDRRGRVAPKNYAESFQWREDSDSAAEGEVEDTPRVGVFPVGSALPMGLGMQGGWGLGLGAAEDGRLERLNSGEEDEDEDTPQDDIMARVAAGGGERNGQLQPYASRL